MINHHADRISIYNSIDLRKLTKNFHEWDEFFNFRECDSTSENYENSFSRVKICNVNFRKSIELCANSEVPTIPPPFIIFSLKKQQQTGSLSETETVTTTLLQRAIVVFSLSDGCTQRAIVDATRKKISAHNTFLLCVCHHNSLRDVIKN